MTKIEKTATERSRVEDYISATDLKKFKKGDMMRIRYEQGTKYVDFIVSEKGDIKK